ncbi:MAG: fatty acid desaturase family protein [Planctomycetota bacterium]
MTISAEISPDAIAPTARYPRAPHTETVRRLSAVRPLRSVGLILEVWAPLVLAMTLVCWMPYWWVMIPAGLVVGSRQVAMGVLVHEAVHYSLFRTKWLNDLVSDLFLAFPIGMSTGLYRKTHLAHHRHTNTDEDPDLAAQKTEREWFEWPKSRAAFYWTLVRSLTGLNFYRGIVMFKQWSPALHLWGPVTPAFPLHTRIIYVLNIAAVYALFGWWFSTAPWQAAAVVAVYLLPGLTVVNLSMRIRATAEHIGVDNAEEIRATRTVLPRWWERLFISPVGVNYHLEHHLFPSVPGPRLAELHRELMDDEHYRSTAHVTKGYDGVMRELMTDRAPGSATVGGSGG